MKSRNIDLRGEKVGLGITIQNKINLPCFLKKLKRSLFFEKSTSIFTANKNKTIQAFLLSKFNNFLHSVKDNGSLNPNKNDLQHEIFYSIHIPHFKRRVLTESIIPFFLSSYFL